MKSATDLQIFCAGWCLLKELESPSVELEYGSNHIKKKRFIKYLKEMRCDLEVLQIFLKSI